MLLDLGIALVGLALVLGGGWLAVRSAAALAERLGWSEAFVGATVVAFGTSAPELVVSALAASRGAGGVAVGNVVGSNIANIALVLGLAAVIAPVAVDRGIVRRDLPVMIVASVAVALVAMNGVVGRTEGALLAVALVVFVVAAYRAQPIPVPGADREAAAFERLEERVPPRPGLPLAVEVALIAAGIALLAGGADLFVRGASAIAERAGVREFAIGATLVATGTSLPEVATSAVAAWRRMSDIAVANVVGSNIFNALFVLGGAALVRPVEVSRRVFEFELPVMLLSAVALAVLAWRRGRIGRTEGALLLGAYVAFTVVTLARG